MKRATRFDKMGKFWLDESRKTITRYAWNGTMNGEVIGDIGFSVLAKINGSFVILHIGDYPVMGYYTCKIASGYYISEKYARKAFYGKHPHVK